MLLLRASVAAYLAGALAYAREPSLLAQVGVAVLAIALLTGACTRLAAGVSAIAIVAISARTGGQLGLLGLLQGADALALCMLGGGAYSIDARLFGRRVIRLDD